VDGAHRRRRRDRRGRRSVRDIRQPAHAQPLGSVLGRSHYLRPALFLPERSRSADRLEAAKRFCLRGAPACLNDLRNARPPKGSWRVDRRPACGPPNAAETRTPPPRSGVCQLRCKEPSLGWSGSICGQAPCRPRSGGGTDPSTGNRCVMEAGAAPATCRGASCVATSALPTSTTRTAERFSTPPSGSFRHAADTNCAS